MAFLKERIELFMMSLTDLPISLWGFALETAAFTLNRASSKALQKTPYEMWIGNVPKLYFLRIWGCEAYVKRLLSNKLSPKSDKCIFVGYPKRLRDTTSTTKAKTKCFWLVMVSFWKRSLFSEKQVGEVRNEQQMDEVNTSSEADWHENVQEAVH